MPTFQEEQIAELEARTQREEAEAHVRSTTERIARIDAQLATLKVTLKLLASAASAAGKLPEGVPSQVAAFRSYAISDTRATVLGILDGASEKVEQQADRLREDRDRLQGSLS